MRLYLSSFRLGTDPTHLVRLAGAGARTAVIANALDAEPPDVRQARVAGEVRALSELGLRPAEIDVREHTGDLAAFDALWVRGGNVFMLRHALAESGVDAAVVELLRADRLVYAGYSAGACVLGPSLDGLETVDDPKAVRRGYGVAADRSGLGVLGYRVVPHVQSPSHPESAALDALAERYRRDGVPHFRLRDGEALVVEDGRSRVVGRPGSLAWRP